MNISPRATRALVTGAALLAPVAAGAGITYASKRFASESKSSLLADCLGQLGDMPLVDGGLAGFAAAFAASRLGRTGMAKLPLLSCVAAGVAGAMAGAWLVRHDVAQGHVQEYAEQQAGIDRAITQTQQMFRALGIPESALGNVDAKYDRGLFNARYANPIGPFGDNIRVGRDFESGVPLGAPGVDVVAHEYSHRVIHQFAPNLGMMPGSDGNAINESLADTFAMAVDTGNWLFGEDALPGGLRSFAQPEVRGAVHNGKIQPAPITRGQLGHAEAHLGAGVGNKAAYRIGSELGRQAMAQVYADALQLRTLGAGSSYADLAAAVRRAASIRWGTDSHEFHVVDDSWTQAGY